MLINKRCKILRIHFSYLSEVSMPLLWLIATIILATFPPVPALLPLAKHPCLRPSDFFSNFPFGSSRLIHGVHLVNKGDSIQIKRNSFGPNSWRVIFLHLSSKFDSFHFVHFTHQSFFEACRKKYPFLFNNRRTVRSVTWRIPALSIRCCKVNEPSRSLNSAMLPRTNTYMGLGSNCF